MAIKVTMPRLFDTHDGRNGKTWLVEEINEGDILAEIETDKATI
jgi:pyruvate/2-oxoglutarate dehydrogenase complex dihydrolipoamide acyltransferase (E2) component